MSAGVVDGQAVNASVTNAAFLSATQGSIVVPVSVDPSGISFSAPNERNQYYIVGNGGPVSVTANPQISVGQTVCQTITFIGQDNTNTVTFSNGNGLSLAQSSITLGLNDTLTVMWTSAEWIQLPNVPDPFTGTVTSVAFQEDSASALYSVTGSPVTGSGTIGITLKEQNTNYVFAGPALGLGAQPEFRALVAADLPNTAVSAGSYTNADITVDAQGRITAASNGTAGGGGGGAFAVKSVTADYTIVGSDFASSAVSLLLEVNGASACTVHFPPASSFSGYTIAAINIGSYTATLSTTGSDTFGSTTDTTWTLIPGGSPQASNIFIANGGSRWNGF